MALFSDRFPRARALIGTIHLPPLPGCDGTPGLAACLDHALADLDVYEQGGLDGVLVENENDHPHRVAAGAETIAAMTVVTRELVLAARRAVIGIELLLNDPEASLAVAAAAGAGFIRSDYFVDAMERDSYGRMRIAPAEVIAFRDRIGAGDVLLLADVQVKYARMIEPRPLGESAALAGRHGADAIVVTGTRTGSAPTVDDVVAARAGSGAVPVLIGSGLDAANAAPLLADCGGAIVGTAFLRDGRADAGRVAALVEALGP